MKADEAMGTRVVYIAYSQEIFNRERENIQSQGSDYIKLNTYSARKKEDHI